jgi:xanthine dehydrogenase small subunit
MENRNKIITSVNSKRIEIEGDKAFMTLAQYLREKESLTGTKVVCAEGDCGACTVLLARDTGADGKLNFKSVNSCIIPLYLVDGAHVVTVEGLKLSDSELHPVQSAMVDCNGAQCGYCTPGFICAMAGLAEKTKSENKTITEKKAKNYLTGNLCRCTGYKPIIEAAVKIDMSKAVLLKDRYHDPEWIEEVKQMKNHSLLMKLGDKTIFLPVTMDEALKAKNADNDLKLIAGSTDIGVVINKGKMTTPKAMALYHIDELKKISHDKDFLTVGATATLSEFEDYVETILPAFKNMLHIFASPQIKNQGTLVGNVVNASPIADTIPFLMAADAYVVLKSVAGERSVMMKDFYVGYKTLNMNKNEIVTAIKIPMPNAKEQVKLFKVSVRRDLDISAVTFAGIVEVENKKIKSARFSLGGVAATVVRLNQIESKAINADFKRESFEDFAKMIPSLINPLSDLRASKEYRLKVAQNFFLKCFDELNAEAKS